MLQNDLAFDNSLADFGNPWQVAVPLGLSARDELGTLAEDSSRGCGWPPMLLGEFRHLGLQVLGTQLTYHQKGMVVARSWTGVIDLIAEAGGRSVVQGMRTGIAQNLYWHPPEGEGSPTTNGHTRPRMAW